MGECDAEFEAQLQEEERLNALIFENLAKMKVRTMMTVEQLIQILSKLPQNSKVVVRGYEDGLNDLQEVKEIAIVPHPDGDKSYYGIYEDASYSEQIQATEPAVYLFGENDLAED